MRDVVAHLDRWAAAGIAAATATVVDVRFSAPRPAGAKMAVGADGRVEGMDAALRFDTQTGAEDVYHFGDGASAGELVFAPRVGAAGEADGYAMTLVHRANAGTSELAIFAATDIAAGPVATVHIPFRVPSGFHCNYYSADSTLYREAVPARATVQ